MKTFRYILLVICFSISFAEARSWEKITIPGAVCGNGQSYSVFLDRKDTDKVLVEFMGGGACWSEGTCYGDSPLTSLQPLEQAPTSVFANDGMANNPWNRHTALFLPYCTGDVHAGQHVTSYKPSVLLYHNGYNNVALTFQYLQQQNILNFQSAKDVTVWGFSAGALGAFLHAVTLEPYLSPSAHKTLIVDSPGLHFGKNFWLKFTPALIRDYNENFRKIDFPFEQDDGFLAPHMGPVFVRYSAWNIGILQSTKDLVMSIVFGNISPDAHRQLVLGSSGIAAIAAPFANVKTWIADTTMHTFLFRDSSANYQDMSGETAWDFAVRVHGMNHQGK
nr:pectin acetylesterase-family hydrolase [uncultured Bdellovibrio sp.]